MWEDRYADSYWENCTDADYAEMIVNRGIELRLKRHNLTGLLEKFKDRNLRVFEIGSGNGEFLKALQNSGFQNIRGLDMNPRHQRKYPELDEIVDVDIIQMRCKPKDEVPYDLVYSNLIFDEDCYQQQRYDEMRKSMLENIHGLLHGSGLYYGSEMHQVDKITQTLKEISPRANSLIIRMGDEKFIPNER